MMQAQIQEEIHEMVQEEATKGVKKKKKKSWKLRIFILLILGKIFCFLLIFAFIVLVMFGQDMRKQEKPGSPTPGTGIANVSPEVMRWEPVVRQYAEQFGIPQYIQFLLALIQQESSGTLIDVMQASESKCGYIGCITNPVESIAYGVERFSKLLQASEGKLYIAAQAYNMGDYFVTHAKGMNTNSDDVGSVETAAKAYAQKYATSLVCSPSYRTGYCYGDWRYVANILRYYQVATTPPTSDGSGDGPANKKFNEIMALAAPFEGRPYVFGGRRPPDFDCSGLVEWSYGQVGINISGTAADQYNKTIAVDNPAPGDLVFFRDTYKAGISHVGIYVGNNRMFNAGGTHLHYADLSKDYWVEHFAGFRRVQ